MLVNNVNRNVSKKLILNEKKKTVKIINYCVSTIIYNLHSDCKIN